MHRTVAWTVLPLALTLAPPLQAAPDRFEHQHEQHAGKLGACSTCHTMTAQSAWAQSGRMGHGACDRCHQVRRQAAAGARPKALCYSCHKGRAFRFPPHRRRGESEFTLARFDHAKHQQPGVAGCALCHQLTEAARTAPIKDSTPEMRPVGHETCGQSICHGERVKPVMATCEGCHVARGAEAVAPLASLADNPFRVAWTFSHTLHEKKAGEAVCAKCHTNAATPAGAPVPLPVMDACGSCHHGQGTFSTLGIQCAWCHVLPGGTP